MTRLRVLPSDKMELLCCNTAGTEESEPTAYPGTRSAFKRHKKVERYLKMESHKSAKIIKTLLLGPSESGKSTIKRQMRIVYSNGFSEDERLQMRPRIFSSLLSDLKALLDIMATEDVALGTEEAKYGYQLSAKLIIEVECHDDPLICSLQPALSDAIRNLWKDPGVETALPHRSQFPFRESLIYFCESIDRLASPGWLPNNQDILNMRFRTTGFSEMSFDIGPTTWSMIELGGSRTERRKWIHLFEAVHNVMFVASLSDYNRYLMEDSSVNQMHEVLNLFDSVVNGRLFKNKPIILFLNKMDIFKDRLAVSPLSDHFPDFKGPGADPIAAAKYIDRRFRQTDRERGSGRHIYTHYTTATDTELMRQTLKSVHDSIVLQNLNSLAPSLQ